MAGVLAQMLPATQDCRPPLVSSTSVVTFLFTFTDSLLGTYTKCTK